MSFNFIFNRLFFSPHVRRKCVRTINLHVTRTVAWNIIQMKMQSQQQQIGPAIIVRSLIVASSAVAKFAIYPGIIEI